MNSKNFCRLALLIFTVFLSSCKFPEPAFEFYEVRFQDLDPGSFFLLDLPEDSLDLKKVRLEVEGIQAIDQKTVFVFGKIDGIGYGRSFVLKSVDSGQSWKEVMEPLWGSSIQDINFISNGHGWILAQWVIEGPGPIKLFHTEDFGENWQEVDFSVSNYAGYIRGMNFFNESHGQLKIKFYMANPFNDQLMLLETFDGGHSWQIKEQVFMYDDFDFDRDDNSPNYDQSDVENMFFEMSGWHRDGRNCFWEHSVCTSVGIEGAVWQLQFIESSRKYELKVAQDESSGWQEEFDIPSWFIYLDGQISVDSVR